MSSSRISETGEMMVNEPLVGVVVLHWNDIDDTVGCVQSLASSGYGNQKVFVVDNGSVVPLCDLLDEQAADVRIIRSPDNVGFAAGCNLGIRAALEIGCDYVWLLNNDTIVDPHALAYLVAKAETVPTAGIIGSTILEQHDEGLVNHVGGWVSPYKGLCVHLGRGMRRELVLENRAEKPNFLTGCSMLVRTAMIRKVGLMDEGYFLYWEDADWCLQARRRGWEVEMAYESVIFHKGSSGLGQASPLKSYYLARNSLRFVFKFYPWLFPLALFWWPRRHFINHLVKGRFSNARMALYGVRDWLQGSVLVPPAAEPGRRPRGYKKVRLRKRMRDTEKGCEQ